MDQTATLSDLARAEIATLEAEGIRLTADEVVEINALGWAVESPETRLRLSRGRPVMVGGAVLWPLTMRAIEWLNANRVDLAKASLAMAYAMAHGRSDGKELDAEGFDSIAAVREWARGLRCTHAELIEAVRQVDMQERQPPAPVDPDGTPLTLGDFSAFLSVVAGGDADFWERRCSFSYCLSALSIYVLHNHADRRPCKLDPRLVAERSLGYALQKIRESRKAQAVTSG